ncbi:glycosyltransferase [Laspinema sp. D1]|uniref:glycosyltransferase family 2 protein n=1 Tax=Laspinema palackyanum TaxID=3231601 RepID=UPI003469C432|nr:glycosyltransferase [Laspinema sp. D2b]
MKKEKIILSIGMPVYNGVNFINKALDSLLDQTFTNFELIISDNASTDETETICGEYAKRDNRIRYIRQPENQGALANFQFVLNEAVGDYFMWAAADDVWDKKWIETLLPISIDGQCIAYGLVQTIDDKGYELEHPANNRKFCYVGYVLFRRLKYFFAPCFLGKANPIYGIFPKNIITTQAFSVLSLSDNGSDMLFLFNLLNKIEIKGGASVYLYKRIHSGCEGGSVPQKSLRQNNALLGVIRQNNALFQSIRLAFRGIRLAAEVGRSRYLDIINYGALSGFPEKVLQVLLLPVVVSADLFYLGVNKVRVMLKVFSSFQRKISNKQQT